MEGWQKGAQAVLKFSSAGKQKYFKQFPEREAWFKQNFPQHFGSSATVATTSLKKVNKAKVQKQRLAAIRHAAAKRDQLKVSSAAVQAMGVRRREGGEGLGGGLETNRDIISHVRGGGTIGSGGLGSLFEQETKSGVTNDKDGNWYYNGQLFPSEKEARAAEKSDKAVGANKEAIDKFGTDIEKLAFGDTPADKVGSRLILPSDRATGFRDPISGRSVDGVTERPQIETGRDWPEKGTDPNWGAILGMKNGWMGDKDEQYALIKTPPAGSEINTRGNRLPFSTIVQGGDMPVDQAKKRGGYYTGRNMEELSRVNEESDNMNNEENALSQAAKELAAKVMEEKRLQECMPMEMNMESKPPVKEAEDEPGEYDYEGDMAKSQLRSIGYNAKMLHDMLEDNTNLPEWVQSKITLAEDYILTAANYMRGEMDMNEEVDTNDLVPRSMLPSKSAIPSGKGFGDDIKREKIMQKAVKAIQKKKPALPTNNPSENELVPQSMLPDNPAASYPPGYILPEPTPTVPAVPAAAKGQKPIVKEEDESPFVNAASKFLTRTSTRLVYGDKND